MTLRVDQEMPTLDHPPLVVGFSGWPDAAEVASGAVAYLIRTLGARRFASIDPEPFYVFGESRPTTLVVEGSERALTWPASEFFAARDPSGRDLVLFLAREPNIRWKAYLDLVLELVQQVQGGPVLMLGGTYDQVSHRGPATISGWSPISELRQALAQLGTRFTTYQGPSSIQSALMEACTRREMPAMSLWGHAPHYVVGVPNPKVVLALLERVKRLLGLEVDLEPLAEAGLALETQIEQALLGRMELGDYVRSLDRPIEEPTEPEPTDSPPSVERIVEDLESFLRQIDQDES